MTESGLALRSKERAAALAPASRFVRTFDEVGIGETLALTIMLETGDINRFDDVGNYVSYGRLVGSSHWTNGKRKGSGNTKNGNVQIKLRVKHLAPPGRITPGAQVFVVWARGAEPGAEPERVAEAAATMRLQHVVLTSVDRDDLPDFGAWAFAETIRQIKARSRGRASAVRAPFRGTRELVAGRAPRGCGPGPWS